MPPIGIIPGIALPIGVALDSDAESAGALAGGPGALGGGGGAAPPELLATVEELPPPSPPQPTMVKAKATSAQEPRDVRIVPTPQ
jgi:hypothetical protein